MLRFSAGKKLIIIAWVDVNTDMKQKKTISVENQSVLPHIQHPTFARTWPFPQLTRSSMMGGSISFL